MRNQRSNFIPFQTKSAKSSARNVTSTLIPKKSSYSQTERVVLIKEENISFYPCTRIGQNDGGMRKDYTKAVNYINSCHKFINAVIEKNGSDKSTTFLLPMVPNFVPLFSYLVGKKATKCKERKRSDENVKVPVRKVKSKSEEQKSKGSCVKTVDEPPEAAVNNVIPVGDSEVKIVPNVPPQKTDSATYAHEVADIVKSQIQQFFSVLHKDMYKATKTKSHEEGKSKCKNVKIVKQRLHELSKICYLQKDLEIHAEAGETSAPPPTETVPPLSLQMTLTQNPPQSSRGLQMTLTQNPPQSNRGSPRQPPQRHLDISEDANLTISDHGFEEVKQQQSLSENGIKITCYNSSSSIASESSDIKSDSDLEINY